MELITANQMRKAEQIAMDTYGISSFAMMDCAASAVAKEIMNQFPDDTTMKIAILTGPGNNGGDGYALAKKLHATGYEITIFSSVTIDRLQGDALKNAEICRKHHMKIYEKKDPIDLSSYAVVVDGLLGIGLSRQVDGLMKKYIEAINDCQGYIVSIDIPSGLECDTGLPLGTAVRADLTVCFERGKIALYTQPGCIYSKKVVIAPLNIPKECFDNIDFSYKVFEKNLALSKFKVREKISSKGSYGHVAIIAGSKGMTGAYKLSVLSCLRSGAGYVYGIVPDSAIYEYNQLVSEAVCLGINEENKGYLSFCESDRIIERLKKVRKISCILIGPGLSPLSKSDQIISALFEHFSCPIIIDAQGLNDLSCSLEVLKKKKGPVVISPHPGEMARLLGTDIKDIQGNRIKKAKEFALKYDTIVLLKGHKSLVTDGHCVYFNSSGNAGMATPGSGDVLAGIIACKSTMDDNLLESMAYGMYLHGLAGDKAKEKYGENGMIASDIINEVMMTERELYEEKTR